MTNRNVCSRLTLLHGLICQGEWRVPSLWHRFVDDVALTIITDTNHFYQNVRSRLGGCVAHFSCFYIESII